MTYIDSWTPLIFVGAIVFLALPWLGLIALLVLVLGVLGALAALTWALVAAALAVGRAIGHRWHGRSTTPQPSPALLLVEQARVPAGAPERQAR